MNENMSSVSILWLIDWLIYLRFYVPLKNISLIWRRHHYRSRAAKFRPMLGAQGLWIGRDFYRATLAVARGVGFSGLIRRTAPFNRLLRYDILTRILTGSCKWTSDRQFEPCLFLVAGRLTEFELCIYLVTRLDIWQRIWALYLSCDRTSVRIWALYLSCDRTYDREFELCIYLVTDRLSENLSCISLVTGPFTWPSEIRQPLKWKNGIFFL
jgi:hypothetical protein